MTQVWRHFFGDETTHTQSAILEALTRAGIDTYPLDPDKPRGPGVLIFAHLAPSLYNFLRTVSHAGLHRVLAVAASRSVLTEEGAWLLLQAGASDVFVWEDSNRLAEEAAARFARWRAVDQLVESSLVRNSLVGDSRAWKSILRQVVEAARFTDASVLLAGESGTGKELVARLIHTLDPRPEKKDLVILDCTTIVPELSGSEFFGHERGAFTGAATPRDGAFALADGGTLFLDEVGELPLPLQAQLLRVIQEGTYKRVGGNTWHRTNFRLVAATNKNLLEAVAQGAFRNDLYYRLASIVCQLPPLRERPEDILRLLRHFTRQFRPDNQPLELDDLVSAYFLTRTYPGNVRDLKQLVTRIIYRHVGAGPITVGDIPEEDRRLFASQTAEAEGLLEHAIRRTLLLGASLKELGRTVTEVAIRIAVDEEGGNLQRAARKLGVSDRALQMRRAVRRGQKTDHDEASAPVDSENSFVPLTSGKPQLLHDEKSLPEMPY
jgi:transcriptional regulator with GAF, ATPase, and Fis domain